MLTNRSTHTNANLSNTLEHGLVYTVNESNYRGQSITENKVANGQCIVATAAQAFCWKVFAEQIVAQLMID